MKPGREIENGLKQLEPVDRQVHPAWRSLIRFCDEMRHGEIECLKIQDGIPVIAEVTRKKIRFQHQ